MRKSKAIFILLFFIVLINYIDRVSISYAAIPIEKIFNVSSNEMGFLFGVFGLGYFISSLVLGFLVDLFRPDKLLLLSILFWGIALVLAAISPLFSIIVFARFCLGLAEGACFPSVIKLATYKVPDEKHAGILSLLVAAVPISLAISGPFLSHLIILAGWRTTFTVLALFGFVWIFFWRITVGNKNNYIWEKEVHPDRRQFLKNLIALNREPTVVANYFAFFAFGYALYFFMNWLPIYLFHQYHIKIQITGVLCFFPWFLGVLFLFIFGRLSDYVFKLKNNYRYSKTYFIVLPQLLSAVCVVPLLIKLPIAVEITLISLSVGFMLASNVGITSTITLLTKQHVGSVVGIADSILSLSAFSAPLLTGIMLNKTGSYKSSFLMLFIVIIGSVLVQIVFHKPDNVLATKRMQPN